MGAKADATRGQLAAARQQVADSRARLAALVAHGDDAAASALARGAGIQADTLAGLRAWPGTQPPAEAQGWADEQAWLAAAAAPANDPGWDHLRVGEHVERATAERLGIPDLIGFVGQERPIIIVSRGPEQHDVALSLLQSLVVRTAVMFGPQARFVLIDPGGAGRNFPMTRDLPGVLPSSGDPRRDLEAVQEDIRRIIGANLGAEARSFEDLPYGTRADEGFRLVFAADYPNRYDVRAVEALQAVAETGGPAGTYVIVHHHLDHDVAGDPQRYLFKKPTVVDVGHRAGTLAGGLATAVVLDAAPPLMLQQPLLAAVRKAAEKGETQITWDNIHPTDPDRWWTETSERAVSATFGLGGSGHEPLDACFGVDAQGLPVVHGALGARTGSGKSTLFHTLICGLATRYGPDELRLSLVDLKFGVEFKPYETLPHADVVCLNASPELARSVIRNQAEEMERRNAIFLRAGVADLAGYRQGGEPEGRLPRLLTLVDEYQRLFEDDRDNEASDLLRALSQQGRSAGIHFLVASQQFQADGMLHRSTTFGNIHLRLAMEMTPEHIAAATEFGPRGRALIAKTCTAPGRIVMNSRGGDDNANVAGRVALLSNEQRTRILAQLRARADAAGDGRAPVLVDGVVAPPLLGNPLVRSLVTQPSWPTAAEVEALGRREARHAGLGLADFPVGEHPLVCTVGQEFNVYGVATVVLRRRMSENVALVGANAPARIGMLAAAAASLALTEAPGRLEVVLIDRTPPGTSGEGVLTSQLEYLFSLGRFGHRVAGTTDEVAAAVGDLATEVRRRKELPEADRAALGATVVLANELDRIDPLCRVADDYGSTDSELGALLTEVVTDGPAVGVHTLCGFSSLVGFHRVFSETVLKQSFRHAVALQMSADDSYSFVQSSGASKLQTAGARPVVALVCDRQEQREVRAKPYSTDAEVDRPTLNDELTTIAQYLYHRWGAAS